MSHFWWHWLFSWPHHFDCIFPGLSFNQFFFFKYKMLYGKFQFCIADWNSSLVVWLCSTYGILAKLDYSNCVRSTSKEEMYYLNSICTVSSAVAGEHLFEQGCDAFWQKEMGRSSWVCCCPGNVERNEFVLASWTILDTVSTRVLVFIY